ncbi:MAG: hypothetical protein WCX71_00850 [Candidatus Buchananbacteria bacterium]
MKKGLIVVLFAPSAGGKDTVISALHQQGIACPCVRETTRAPRSKDNGFYRFVTAQEFQKRRLSGSYVFDHEYCGYGYSVPINDLGKLLDDGNIPILKGEITQIEHERRRLLELWPNVRLMTIELVPKPLEKWLEVIRLERYDNVEARIADGVSELGKAQGELRNLIDHLVDNHFGELERTIESVKSLITV